MPIPYQRRSFGGGAITTTLTSPMGATDTTFSITVATNWPSGAIGPF